MPAGQQRPTDCAIIGLAKPFAIADSLQLRLRALRPVQSLFAAPLPTDPEAVRIVFSRYHFSLADEPPAWWTREPIATTRALPCGDGAGP